MMSECARWAKLLADRSYAVPYQSPPVVSIMVANLLKEFILVSSRFGASIQRALTLESGAKSDGSSPARRLG
jgi:hypothetical protein